MRGIARLAIVSIAATSIGYAQNQQSGETVDERLARLESAIATLETQLLARTTTGAGSLGRDSAGLEIIGRVDRLEQQLGALSFDLQRIAQQADAAMREASEARRTAMSAERAARDALMRPR